MKVKIGCNNCKKEYNVELGILMNGFVCYCGNNTFRMIEIETSQEF